MDYGVLIFVIGIVLCLIQLLVRIKTPYKNLLGLQALPDIDELALEEKKFSSKNDEFVYILKVLKGWKRKNKSLADFVTSQEQRDALLSDLDKLKDKARRDIKRENKKEATEGVIKVIERREIFLQETFPYEEGRLLSWEPPIEMDRPFDFYHLKGLCVLTYQSGAVTKIRLQLQEAGLFSVGWKEAGSISEEEEAIKNEMRIDGSAAVTIKLQKPKKGGTIYIRNHTRKVVERVPVS